MGKAIGVLVIVLTIWAALAQIMPETFQMTREKHRRLMAVAFGQKSIWVAVILVGVLLGGYVWGLEERLAAISALSHPSSTITQPQDDPVGLTFASWTADESSCAAVIDGSKVSSDMQHKFDLAIVCGYSDPVTDMTKDTRITISQLFIVQPAVRIASNFSKAMTDALRADQDLTLAKITPKPKRGTVMQETNQIWIKAILVPKGFDTSNIHKLSDVTTNGGMISDRMAAVAIIRMITTK